jgi:hypothetical protein
MTSEVEALILLTPGGAARLEEVEAALAAAGARIVAGFLPHALMVLATERALDDLHHSLAGATVYTAAILRNRHKITISIWTGCALMAYWSAWTSMQSNSVLPALSLF